VIDSYVEYNRVTPAFLKQISGSSLGYLPTTTTIDFFQKPDITFPYKKATAPPLTIQKRLCIYLKKMHYSIYKTFFHN